MDCSDSQRCYYSLPFSGALSSAIFTRQYLFVLILALCSSLWYILFSNVGAHKPSIALFSAKERWHTPPLLGCLAIPLPLPWTGLRWRLVYKISYPWLSTGTELWYYNTKSCFRQENECNPDNEVGSFMLKALVCDNPPFFSALSRASESSFS